MRTQQSEFRVLLHALIPAVAAYEQGRIADEKRKAEIERERIAKRAGSFKKHNLSKENKYERRTIEFLVGGPATSCDIGRVMDVSRTTAFKRLIMMEKRGLVTRTGHGPHTRWVKA